MANYIIGSGTIGSLAKIVFPEYEVISTNIQGKLPISVLWDTPDVKIFLNEYCITAKPNRFKLHTVGTDVKQYNKITMKKDDNVASEGRTYFDGYKIQLQPCEIDIEKEITMINIDKKKLMCMDEVFDFDNVLICSPLTFDIVYDDVKYNHSRCYKPLAGIEIKTELDPTTSDYFYTMEKKYLDKKLYRIVKKEPHNYVLEFAASKKKAKQFFNDLNDILKVDFGAMTFINYYENKYAHFYDYSMDELTNNNNAYFISRMSRLNNDWKMNDTISMLLKLRAML